MRYASSFRSCRPSVYHIKMKEFRLVPFPTAQQVNVQAELDVSRRVSVPRRGVILSDYLWFVLSKETAKQSVY